MPTKYAQVWNGHKKTFEAATKGDCILPIRILLFGEASLAKRDEALGSLLNLRPFLSEWLTFCAASDSAGQVPLPLEKWRLTGAGDQQTTFINSLLKLELDTLDWMGSETQPGLLHYLNYLQHQLQLPEATRRGSFRDPPFHPRKRLSPFFVRVRGSSGPGKLKFLHKVAQA